MRDNIFFHVQSIFHCCYLSLYAFCRFVSSVGADKNVFEPLSEPVSCFCKLRMEDIGRCLRCECVITDVFGRSSEPVSVETSPILPGTFSPFPFADTFLSTPRFPARYSLQHNMPQIWVWNLCRTRLNFWDMILLLHASEPKLLMCLLFPSPLSNSLSLSGTSSILLPIMP